MVDYHAEETWVSKSDDMMQGNDNGNYAEKNLLITRCKKDTRKRQWHQVVQHDEQQQEIYIQFDWIQIISHLGKIEKKLW